MTMFSGSMVALATPMQEGVGPETALDIDAMARLVNFHVGQRTDALVDLRVAA